jgi:DNA ligase-1
MTGAGLKDEDLENLYNELNKYKITAPRNDYRIGDVEVDVFFDAQLVWEIKTADLSLSPIYTAAADLTPENKGISLRFPRYIRLRPDKKPEECTSSEDVYQMYKNQSVNTKPINFAEEDVYE